MGRVRVFCERKIDRLSEVHEKEKDMQATRTAGVQTDAHRLTDRKGGGKRVIARTGMSRTLKYAAVTMGTCK